jgi:excisionase family DNA binding protein
MSLPYPPPYQDIATLSEHTTLAPRTIEMWVKEGKLPPPRVRGGKRLWKWTDVERYLDGDGDAVPALDDQLECIRNATRQAASRNR